MTFKSRIAQVDPTHRMFIGFQLLPVRALIPQGLAGDGVEAVWGETADPDHPDYEPGLAWAVYGRVEGPHHPEYEPITEYNTLAGALRLLIRLGARVDIAKVLETMSPILELWPDPLPDHGQSEEEPQPA